MSDTIEPSILEMIKFLDDKCPILKPAIFPTQSCPNPHSLESLCSSNDQIEEIKLYSFSNSKSSVTALPAIAFSTDINYSERIIHINKINKVSELDALLYSLENVMKLMVMGNEDELIVAMTRFFEINGYNGNISEERHIFNEVYHIAYAIKIAISNVPDMQILLGNDISIPFNSNIDINKTLNKYLINNDNKKEISNNTKKSSSSKKQHKENKDSDSDSDDSEEEVEEINIKKRRRKGRGK
jgi:hypothetical protein